jgi:putative colanic acid biosynthesis acetyltransferase WcaF
MSDSLHIRLDLFDPNRGFSRGKSRGFEILWYLIKMIFFLSAFPWPSRLKVALLRGFGAKVGKGVVIQPRTSIHLPWRLQIGNHCWIGQNCELQSMAQITLEDHVALAHEVFLATGNHDYKDSTMPYRNEPILIKRGTWVASRVFVGPGVCVGEGCVLGAGSVVTKSVPAWSIVQGNPAVVVRKRVMNS